MTALQFSGGADSLATLFVKRPQWRDLTVVWCDTGSAYPLTRRLMDAVRELVPNFFTVQSEKHDWEMKNGTAVDLVPERYTPLGHTIHGTVPGPLYASPWACCAANLWAPMQSAMRRMGVTTIIRGQRSEERRKSPIRDGHIEDGVRYEFPIEGWTRREVMDYCKRECPDLLPSYYSQGEDSSHDCWDCIAYLDDNRQRIANLDEPMHEAVWARLVQYRAAVQHDLP